MTDVAKTGSQKLTANIKAAGCAAKISPAELAEILRELPRLSAPNLLTSMDNFEDAAVYKISADTAIIQTTDFFPPVVDDPYTYGRIAAVNALSDVYAMGGRPVLALNILCFPTCDYPPEVLKKILRGGADAVVEAGACMAGGHSIQAPEPVYGLSVMGIVHPDHILTNGGAHAGDAIILCKPIGTGVGLLGLKGEQLKEQDARALLLNLSTLNDKALARALEFSIHAATDVTGFGLAGHLHEMAAASGLSAKLYAGRVPLLPAVLELAAQGFVPAGAYANRNAYREHIRYKYDPDEELMDLFFDPQTAGGLLLALERKSARELVAKLTDDGLNAAIVGEFQAGNPGEVEVFEREKDD